MPIYLSTMLSHHGCVLLDFMIAFFYSFTQAQSVHSCISSAKSISNGTPTANVLTDIQATHPRGISYPKNRTSTDDIFRTKVIHDNRNFLCIPLTISYLSICLLWPNADLLSRNSNLAGTPVNVCFSYARRSSSKM
jgi:hypothetical protein